MTANELAIGDMVTVKGETYGCFQVRNLYPKGLENKKCYMVEVVHYSGYQPSEFGIIRKYRKVDLRKAQK